MPVDKQASEPQHTKTDLEMFLDHEARLIQFTTSLQERRCRRTNRFDDEIQTTMQVFRPLFAPWNMESLFILYMHGPHRFNEIKRVLGGVSSRVLTDKLRHLEDHRLVERTVSEDGRPVHYSLTGRGLTVARHLHPLLFALQNDIQPRVEKK